MNKLTSKQVPNNSTAKYLRQLDRTESELATLEMRRKDHIRDLTESLMKQGLSDYIKIDLNKLRRDMHRDGYLDEDHLDTKGMAGVKRMN